MENISEYFFARSGIYNAVETDATETAVQSIVSSLELYNSLRNGIFRTMSPTSYGACVNNVMSERFRATSPNKCPSHSVDGITFNGVDQHENTGFNTLNNSGFKSGFVAVSISNNVSSGGYICGASSGATASWIMRPNHPTNGAYFTALSDATKFTAPTGSSLGVIIFSMLGTGIGQEFIMYNGVVIGTNPAVITGTQPNLMEYLGCRNLSNAPNGFINHTVNLYARGEFGISITAAQNLTTIFQTLNQNIIPGGR